MRELNQSGLERLLVDSIVFVVFIRIRNRSQSYETSNEMDAGVGGHVPLSFRSRTMRETRYVGARTGCVDVDELGLVADLN